MIRLRCAFAACAALVNACATAPEPAPPREARLTVQVLGVKTNEGRVCAALYAERDRWLTPEGVAFGASAPAVEGTTEILFDVPPGRYGLSVFHDRNSNADLDRGALGLPGEPWGFGNSRATLGPASFEQAAIEVEMPSTVVEVRLRPAFPR